MPLGSGFMGLWSVMRAVIQRALEGQVRVDGKTIGEIGKGYVIFLGVADTDTKEIADKMAKKILGLRIFDDENDKINLSLKDVDGEILLISQFTLYAQCRKGNRPSFVEAGKPDYANELYEYMIKILESECRHVGHGEFGADMKVSLINDGPFTIYLDSEQLGF